MLTLSNEGGSQCQKNQFQSRSLVLTTRFRSTTRLHSTSLSLRLSNEGEALLVEQFARDLPTSHKVEDVAFVLLRTGEVSVYFRESGHVQEMFVRSNLRTPTPREALTFAATLPGLLDKHEIHVIGSDERLNEHLMMFHDGERRALFSYIWGGVPIIARNACFLAVSTQQ